MPGLTTILPMRNASSTLPGTLARLEAARRSALIQEIVAVDGGSTDGSHALAVSHGVRVITTAPGRGRQLAAGAAIAESDWLLFLHADTRLGPGWEQAVTAFTNRPDATAKAAVFRLAFDADSRAARRTAALANGRTRVLGLPYGDQGLLMARSFYERLGGFDDIPLMEDVALVRRIGRKRLTVLDAEAITSAEKYRRDGWVLRPLRNLSILSLYFAGVPPHRLKRLYG